jgi:hypothetical protein
MPEDYTQAIVIVNQMQDSMTGLARAIADALTDNKISPWEGMALGMKGMAFASQVMTLLQSVDANTLRGVFHVLEHGEWVLPPSA